MRVIMMRPQRNLGLIVCIRLDVKFARVKQMGRERS